MPGAEHHGMEMATPAQTAVDMSAMPDRIAAATIVMPPSRSSPPELPPPRT
jgi:hypothetical protein